MTDESQTTTWPSLGERAKTWDATCDRCNEVLYADTPIVAVWSPKVFHVACRCSPQQWITMECS